MITLAEKQTSNNKPNQNNRNKVNPVEVERYLKGIDFPVNKSDLIEHAHNNDAPEDVLDILERFKDREYYNAADVAKEVTAR